MTCWRNELDHVIRSWIGTRWAARGSTRGVRANCLGFVCGVLDELYGLQVLPPVVVHAFLTRRGAGQAARVVTDRYPCEVARDKSILPGDVLLARRDDNVPGHLLIAGRDASILWHCTRHAGVCRASTAGLNVVRVYRTLEKETWTRRS